MEISGRTPLCCSRQGMYGERLRPVRWPRQRKTVVYPAPFGAALISGAWRVCCIAFLCFPEILRIEGQQFDRGSLVELRRDVHHGRDSAIDRKRQSLDQFLVGNDPVVAGRQYPIHPLQRNRMMERDGFVATAYAHSSTPSRRRICIISREDL